LQRTKLVESAVTDAPFAPLHGLPVGPVSLSTTPVPLRKTRARHERHPFKHRMSDGFRLRLGARRCTSASLRYPLLSAFAPLPASRPQTEANVQ